MTDAEAIAQRRETFMRVFNAMDIDGLADLVTEGVYAMPPNQPPVPGLEAHRTWWAEMFEYGEPSIQVDPQELEVIGDRAFDRFNWTMEVTPPDGEATRDSGKCVWLWQRGADGTWRVSHSIWNSDQPVGGPW